MRLAIGWPIPHHRPRALLAGAPSRLAAKAFLAALLALPALTVDTRAQTAVAPPKHNNNTYGSPLDTLRSTHLWTDTPEPKDFVRNSRPEAAALDYAPLTGADPTRAKPRDAANVAALQAELERAGASQAARNGRTARATRRAGAKLPPRRAAPADGAPPS